jgi:hypothetical protein
MKGNAMNKAKQQYFVAWQLASGYGDVRYFESKGAARDWFNYLRLNPQVTRLTINQL